MWLLIRASADHQGAIATPQLRTLARRWIRVVIDDLLSIFDTIDEIL
jgi:hypothetical protein